MHPQFDLNVGIIIFSRAIVKESFFITIIYISIRISGSTGDRMESIRSCSRSAHSQYWAEHADFYRSADAAAAVSGSWLMQNKYRTWPSVSFGGLFICKVQPRRWKQQYNYYSPQSVHCMSIVKSKTKKNYVAEASFRSLRFSALMREIRFGAATVQNSNFRSSRNS